MITIPPVSRRGFLEQAFTTGAFVVGARLVPLDAKEELDGRRHHQNHAGQQNRQRPGEHGGFSLAAAPRAWPPSPSVR